MMRLRVLVLAVTTCLMTLLAAGCAAGTGRTDAAMDCVSRLTDSEDGNVEIYFSNRMGRTYRERHQVFFMDGDIVAEIDGAGRGGRECNEGPRVARVKLDPGVHHLVVGLEYSQLATVFQACASLPFVVARDDSLRIEATAAPIGRQVAVDFDVDPPPAEVGVSPPPRVCFTHFERMEAGD